MSNVPQTSVMAYARIAPKLSDTHASLLRLFMGGRRLCASQAQDETGIAAHKRFPEMVRKGLIRKAQHAHTGIPLFTVHNGRTSALYEAA